MLLVAGMAIAGVRSLEGESVDDRPCPWVLYGMLAALGVFMLHNLLDFAMSETSPLFLFALLAGSALGVRQPSLAGHKRHTGWAIGWLCGASIAWVAVLVSVAAPTIAGESAGAEGDAAMREGRFDLAARSYNEAGRSQPLDADHTYRAAVAMIRQGARRNQVVGYLELAIQKDPYAGQYHLALARYQRQHPGGDGALIREEYEEAIRLNHASVPLRLEYAEALETKLNDKPGRSATARWRGGTSSSFRRMSRSGRNGNSE